MYGLLGVVCCLFWVSALVINNKYDKQILSVEIAKRLYTLFVSNIDFCAHVWLCVNLHTF